MRCRLVFQVLFILLPLIRSPGADYVAVARDRLGDSSPTWSPDGKKIAFVSDRVGQEEIYLMNTDGSNIQRLTHSKSADQPSWSPDGKSIVFSLKKGTNHWELAAMNAAGTGLKELTRHERGFLGTLGWFGRGVVGAGLKLPPEQYDLEVDLETPAWSPDGKSIAFALGSTRGKHEIFLMDLTTGNLEQLTKLEKNIAFPAWSPDGKKIVFVSFADKLIYGMSADGSEVEQLTHEGDCRSPVWSPDGKTIALSRKTGNYWQVYLMDADGSSMRQITNDESSNETPTWSPNGKQIAFASTREHMQTHALYLMDVDGSNARKLVH